METVPRDKWTIIPATIESSIDWQLGHLIISYYFHSIMVIRGHQMDILQQLPIRDYSEWFTAAAPLQSPGRANSAELEEHLLRLQQKSLAMRQASELDDQPQRLTLLPPPNERSLFELLSIPCTTVASLASSSASWISVTISAYD